MSLSNDRKIIRELAKRYVEIAADEKNNERYERAKGINDLKPARPVVWVEQIPWHEVDIGDLLVCECDNEQARDIEKWLRQQLYRSEYIQDDMIAEPVYKIQKAYDDASHWYGLPVQIETLATDENNDVRALRFTDLLETDEQLSMLRMPDITPRPEIDNKLMDFALDMFGETLAVELCGHYIHHAPWDHIPHFRGVEPVLFDMIERPEHVHKMRAFFLEHGLSLYNQMETFGLLDYNTTALDFTPQYSGTLPASDYNGGKIRKKDVWFRAEAQIFSSVSPQMFDEFELQYMRPLMELCGPCFYGCCEPLDRLIPLLKTIPTMRKLSVSPWADARSCAEQIGKDYVYSHKPNPAFVVDAINEDAVRKEITNVVEACLENGCPYEIILKDISTVSYKPQNLIKWMQVVKETLDKYYS